MDTRERIRAAAHEWLETSLDAGCEGHPPNPYPPADCEQLADAIVDALSPPAAGGDD